MEFTVSAAGFPITCTVTRMGDDLVVSVGGGDAAHVGCTAMAVPRPSLTGIGRSATVSVLNRLGHKDDFLAQPIAHGVAARLDCAVVCAAGVHMDDAAPDQIRAVQETVPDLVERICAFVEGAAHG